MAGVLEVTARYDLGAPCVQVDVSGLDQTVRTITITRTAAGRAFPVRGAVAARVQGGFTTLDYEAPFVSAQYQVEQFDKDGATLGFVPAQMVELTSDRTWMHHPLDPSGAVALPNIDTAAKTISRHNVGNIIDPFNRASGVLVSGIRRGLTGLVMDVWAGSVDIDRVERILDQRPPVICIRKGGNAALMPIPATLFLGVLAPDLEPHPNAGGGIYRLTGDEVDPPTWALVTPTLTYADLSVSYPTYADFTAAYPTYADADSDYTLAGAADQGGSGA